MRHRFEDMCKKNIFGHLILDSLGLKIFRKKRRASFEILLCTTFMQSIKVSLDRFLRKIGHY